MIDGVNTIHDVINKISEDKNNPPFPGICFKYMLPTYVRNAVQKY